MNDIKLKFEKKGLGKIYKTINKLYKNETINENELNFYLNEIPKLKVGSKKFNSIKSDIKTFKKDADNEKKVKSFYNKLNKNLFALDKKEIERFRINFSDLRKLNINKKQFVYNFIKATEKYNREKKILLKIVTLNHSTDENGYPIYNKITNYYTLNDQTKRRLYALISDVITEDTQLISHSDAEYFADINLIDSMTISILKPSAKNKKVSGEFFKYLNMTKLDLSMYQIYNKQQFNENNHHNCCLYFALKKLGLSFDKLSTLKILIKNRNVPLSDIEKICEKAQICIKVKKSCNDRNKTFIYGKQFHEVYNVGLIKEHYFQINETNYTKYYIENVFKLDDDQNNVINNKMEKRNDRFIDSYDLISMMVSNKESYLENISFDNCNVASTQFYDKIDETVLSLKYDVATCTKLVMDEEIREEEKMKKLEEMASKILGKKSKKDLHNIYFDFETYKNKQNLHIPYLVCAYYEKDKKSKYFFGEDCGKKFLNSIKYDCLLIAHNVSYDYRFIVDYLYEIKEISRGKKLIGCNAKYNGFKVNIKDSYHLIGQPLRNFKDIFKLDVKKEVMPYSLYSEETINKKWIDLDECLKHVLQSEKELFIKNIKEWDLLVEGKVDILTYSLRYCLLDCEVLQQGYNIFKLWMEQHFEINCDECLTIASLAHKYLINTGCYDNVYQLGGIPQMFIQGCVVGGRTMCCNNEKQTFNLEGDETKKMQDFDAVSLYPSAMKRMKGFLKGVPKVLNNLSYDFLKEQDGYFIEIKIKKINIKQNFSLMSYKTEEGIRLFTNDMIDKIIKVDKITLEDLIEYQKIEFEVIRGYYFNDGHNDKINKVIEYIFSKRLELKKVKNPAELTYKLIMNNAYGKSIMKPIETEVKIFTDEKEFDVYIDRNYNWINNFNTFGIDDDKYKVNVIKKLDEHFNICQVGVEILSMSKRIMNEVLCLAEEKEIKIYYQDTDSMHIEEQDIEPLSDAFTKKYNRELIGKNMGQFHSDFSLDGASDVYATKSIFLGKKSYIDELKGVSKTGEIITGYHIRMKGIPNACIEYTAEKLNLNNPFELYQQLLEGKKISFDLTQDGKKDFFEFTKDYKVMTKNEFMRDVVF